MVAGFLARKGLDGAAVRAVLDDVSIDRIPFDDELALRTGVLEPRTRSAGLSLGDRACLALAERLDLAAMTTDRAWSSVAQALGVAVQVIR